MRKIVAPLAAASVAAAAYAFAMPPSAVTEAGRVAVTARPIPLHTEDPGRIQVGRLRYLGGLELAAKDRRFGGLSGLRWRDGLLVAISDTGNWVTIEPRETGGRLTGIGRVTMAPMLGPDGRRLGSKSDADAEALEIDADGRRYVSFEGEHRVWRYDGAAAPAVPSGLAPDKAMGGLPDNGGLETMARVGSRWLWLSEELDDDGASKAVTIDGSGAAVVSRYRAPPAFRPTDADALDEARVLMLSRRASPLAGMAAAIELVGLDDQGRIAKAAPVAELAPPLSVDNMEGLAVRGDGQRIFVYLVSDDNFSPLQRTLLMKFELLP